MYLEYFGFQEMPFHVTPNPRFLFLSPTYEEAKARSKSDLLDCMNDILLARIDQGREIVVIIDEAQNLSFEVMEMLRMLSNLETYDQKLLQIILMGQPELNEKLKEERLRQFRQRVLVHYDLKPLNRSEVQLYILHRLSLSGSNGQPRFTPRAIKKIAASSLGIPRMINNICDKSLLSTFIRNGNEVNYWDVRKALKDINRLHG